MLTNEKLLEALRGLVGSPDDPRNGWLGTATTSRDHFRCEYCGVEDLDCIALPHADGCPVAVARACIAAHCAKGDSVHLTQPEGGTVPGDWRTVARDGLPKYQPEVTYIGINSAGFAACFTIVDPDGACWVNTGEENICVMSELAHWRVLDRPANK